MTPAGAGSRPSPLSTSKAPGLHFLGLPLPIWISLAVLVILYFVFNRVTSDAFSTQ